MNYHFTLDGFDFELTKTDAGLLIEADHKESAQLFTKLLTPESVQTISQDSFFDLSTTYQVMKDYFEEKPETASLSLTPEGKLTYTCKLSFGKVLKEIAFEIQLEKKDIDVLGRLERGFNKLSTRMANLEKGSNNGSLDQETQDKKMVAYFSDFEKRLFDRLIQIEDRLTKVEERVQRVEGNGNGQLKVAEEKIQGEAENLEREFNVESSFAKPFVFSNSNKTISAGPFSAGKRVFTNRPFLKSKISKLSFRIEENQQKGIGIGVAPTETFDKLNPWQSPKAYMYSKGGKDIWKSGKTVETNNPTPEDGDILTLIVNLKTGDLTVEINGKMVDQHKLHAEDVQSVDFYAFVHLGRGSGSVTLL